jgi:hypothetical protein
LLQAEARAEFAEKTVKKLQKEVDRLEGTCVAVLVANCLLNPKVDLLYSLLGRRHLNHSFQRILIMVYYVWVYFASGFYPLPRFPKSSASLNITVTYVEILWENADWKDSTLKVTVTNF